MKPFYLRLKGVFYVLLCLLITPVLSIQAQGPTTITDASPGTATKDGTVGAMEYIGSSTGINSGFGDVFGATSALHADGDHLGNLNFALVTGGGSFNDAGVIYIDAIAGGFTSTSSFTDASDPGRAAISATGHGGCGGGSGKADITFASGFEADYAIAFQSGAASLFSLGTPTHTFIAGLNPVTATAGHYEIDGLTLGTLGLNPGDTFTYVATYGNPCDGGGFFRSDEFHGIASATIAPFQMPGLGNNIGVNAITLGSGDFNTFISFKTDSCSPDTFPPVITCPGNAVLTNDAGQCSAILAYTIDTSDNCSIDSVYRIAGLASGSAFPGGTTIVTYVIRDAALNTDTCSFTVTVNDTEDPVVSCPAAISVANDAGLCSAVVNYTVTSSDNCAIDTTFSIAGLANGAAHPVGVTTNTYVTIDESGNTDTCSFTVTVNDTEDPVVSCPAAISVANDAGLCSAVVNYTVTSSDNCAIDTLFAIAGLADGAAHPVGVTTNTYVTIDESGNTDTCSFTVTVNDTEDPLVSCPAAVSVANDAGLCSAVVNYAVTSSDNCAIDTLFAIAGLADGAAHPVGVTTNTYVTIDESGNTDTCSFTVTVNDTEEPVVSCPAAISVANDAGLCSAVVNYTVTSSDNCAIDTLFAIAGLADGAAHPVGVTTNIYVTIDEAGNTDTCSFTVTVNDNEDPVVSCPAAISVANDAGLCSAVVNYSVTSSDNCAIDTLFAIAGLADGAAHPVGVTTNTYVTIDEAGNTDTCTFTVTVNDTEDPVFSCPVNATVSTDPGVCSAIYTYTIGSSDNCGVDTTFLIAGLTSGSTFPLGITTVSWVAIDGVGNSDTCSFDVTVEDNEPPTAICPSNATLNTEATQCSAVFIYLNNATDNCGISVIQQIAGLVSGSAFPLGVTTNTAVATDNSGNRDTCSFTVTVIDNENPSVACPSDTVLATDPGQCTAVYNYTVSGIDNCSVVSISSISGLASGAAFPVGVTTNSYVGLDDAGNSDTCSFSVTVNDLEAPIATCPADATVTTDPGFCSAIYTYTIGSSDNCVVDTSFNIGGLPSGSTYPLGATVNTIVVLDENSLGDTCSFSVTVNDTEAPTLSCPSSVTLPVDSGLSTANYSYSTTNGDNCNVDTVFLIAGLSSGSDFPLGITTNTLVAVDASANSDTCSFTVEVTDTEDPIISCPGNVTLGTDPSACSTIYGYLVTATDNDGIDTILQLAGLPSGSSFPLGVTTNTFVAVDNSGATDTCSFTVTVQDLEPPIATCPVNSTNVVLDANGNSILPANLGDGSSTDNCGPITETSLQISVSCALSGTQQYELVAEDQFGNRDTVLCSFTVIDNINPVISCPGNVTVNNDAGNCSAVVTGLVATAMDTCGILIITNNSPFAFAGNADASGNYPVGSTTVTFVATDSSGNTDTCSMIVTVTDNELPLASCSFDFGIGLNSNGQTNVNVNQVDNSSSDNCGIASRTLSQSLFTCADIGLNAITLTVTDLSGNQNTCITNVLIQDNVPPSAQCRDITINLDVSGTSVIIADSLDAGSSDNCSVDSFAANPTSLGCTDLGITPVTLTAFDATGNANSCLSNVTLIDTVAPIALCQSATIQIDSNGIAVVLPSQVDNGSVDACLSSLSVDPDTFTNANLGANLVTLTVTDLGGLTSTCTDTVFVADNVPPNALCKDDTVALDSSGVASILPEDIDNGSNDATGMVTLSLDDSTFTCQDVGITTVTLTVTDENNNASTCTGNVLVEDLIAPSVVCQPFAANLSQSGSTSITINDVLVSASDACGVDTSLVNQTVFDCNHIGDNPVTITVTDANGNSSVCNTTVSISDITAPTVTCQDLTVYLDNGGSAAIVAADVEGSSSDACGIDTLILSQSVFGCADVAVSIDIILTALDQSGNFDTCTASITVLDTLAATAVCADTTLQLDSLGSVVIDPIILDGGSSDACGIASFSIPDSSFKCIDVGMNAVTVTITDVNGNVSSCVSNVLVQDATPPTIFCEPYGANLDINGIAVIDISDVEVESSDVCGIDSKWLDIDTFDCSHVGVNTVTLSISDVNGNVGTCQTSVIIGDATNPQIGCTNATIYLDSSGIAELTVNDIVSSSSDVCGIDTITLSNTTFTCANIPLFNTVMATATDVNGNSNACFGAITVIDTLPPIAVCQDLTLNLNNFGNAGLLANDLNGGSSDNCQISSLAVSTSFFTCGNIGTNLVQLTVNDNNGNSSNCIATVTVQDVIPPNPVCKPINVKLKANGTASISAAALNNGSTDACSAVSLSTNITTVGCDDDGIIATLYVEDASGNRDSCTSVITVQDKVNPTAICLLGVSIGLDSSGIVTIPASLLAGNSFDNCGVDTIFMNPDTFDCDHVGANNVTVTVRDESGNQGFCGTTVFVQDFFGTCTPNCPAPASNSSTMAGYTVVRLNWDTVGTAIAYRIEGRPVGAPFTVSLIVSGGATNFKDIIDLASGTAYEWRIQAVCTPDLSVVSAFTPYDTFSTLTCPAPDSTWETGITSTSVTVNWTTVAGATGYVLVGGVPGATPVTLDLPGGFTNSFTAFGLTPGATYTWAVLAQCQDNPEVLSDFSALRSFTLPTSGNEAKNSSGEINPYLWNPVATMRVFPNPNEGRYSIALNNILEEGELVIYDVLGRMVKQLHIPNHQSEVTLNIDMEGLEKGTYLIQTRFGNSVMNERVIVQ